MLVVTKKPDLKNLLDLCFKGYTDNDIECLVNNIAQLILTKKIKFPLLEYAAHEIYHTLPPKEHIYFCDKIEQLKTLGGNVLLGIILQNRLTKNFNESFEKAAEYISKADAWYICDIVGERVFGFGLLLSPEKALIQIKRLAQSDNNWVVRSIGAGGHYAIKKGLPFEHVTTFFKILLSQAKTKDKEIKQGIGWAAKTTAKFHPELILQFQGEIDNTENVSNWFRKKIEIGLARNAYAKRN